MTTVSLKRNSRTISRTSVIFSFRHTCCASSGCGRRTSGRTAGSTSSRKTTAEIEENTYERYRNTHYREAYWKKAPYRIEISSDRKRGRRGSGIPDPFSPTERFPEGAGGEELHGKLLSTPIEKSFFPGDFAERKGFSRF